MPLKTLIIAYKDVCIKLTRHRAESVPELGSTQKEAGTRFLLHSSHAASSRFPSTIIISKDKDVFILCLYKPSRAQFCHATYNLLSSASHEVTIILADSSLTCQSLLLHFDNATSNTEHSTRDPFMTTVGSYNRQTSSAIRRRLLNF